TAVTARSMRSVDFGGRATKEFGMRTLTVIIVTTLVPAMPVLVRAQSDAGQISGFVRDAQQGALPGATITAVNEATGASRSTATTPAGFYVRPDIPVGPYTLSVELPGFKKFVRTGIRLTTASQIEIDGELELGALEETVTVTAGASLVQTTTAQVART